MDIPGYSVLRQLGRGGMATVYLALQKSVEREVALKVMSPFLLSDPTFGERFLREARIAAKMTHRHIVQVHDVGRAGDHHYIAMEYLGAGEVIDDGAGGLDVVSVLRITKEIASALGYAHAKGFVHRDVKPDNILKRDDGAAVLTDFGIARAADSQTHMTKTGSVIGTPHYMSPEQARGRPVDGRADLYSLGVVFYEMLMGRVPYTADDSLAVGIMHITQPIPELPTRLALFQALLNQMLAKLPEERFQTGDALVDEIEALESRIHSGEFPALFEPAPQTRVRVPAPMARTKPSTPVTWRDGRVEPTFGRMEEMPTAVQPRESTTAPRRTGGFIAIALSMLALGLIAAVYVWREQSRLPPVALPSAAPTLPITAPPAVSIAVPPTPAELQSKPFPAASRLLPKVNAAINAGRLFGSIDAAVELQLQARTQSLPPADLDAALALTEPALAAELKRRPDASGDALLLAWRELAPSSVELGLAVASRAASAQESALVEQLNAASAASQAGRLLGSRSADVALAQALKLAPDDTRVRAALDALAVTMLRRAERFLADRELDRATALLNRADAINSRTQGLTAARLKLAALTEDRDTQAAAVPADSAQSAQIEALLAQAAAHVQAGQLNSPPLDNAYDAYKQVLRLDPRNAPAQAGLKQLPARFQALFEQALLAQDVVKADEYYSGLRDIGLPPQALDLARTRLVDAYIAALARARSEGRENRAKNYAERLRQLAPNDPRVQ